MAIYRIIKEFDIFYFRTQFHCVLPGLKIFDGGNRISILQRITIGIKESWGVFRGFIRSLIRCPLMSTFRAYPQEAIGIGIR